MSELIYIGAGHGGSNSTPGKRTPDGEYEWNFNDKVVDAAIKHLTFNGFRVVRMDDSSGKSDISLSHRTNSANAAKASLYISVHHNAGPTGTWFDGGGTETFFYEGSSTSKKLATLIHAEMLKAYGLKDRKLKSGNHLWEIRKSNMPSVLIEGGFMDSRQDIVKMRNDSVLAEAGKGIAKAVCSFYGKVFKEEAPAPKPTPKPPVSSSKTVYRVRKSWGSPSTQIGAYSDLQNAIDVAKDKNGYFVYDEKGNQVYPKPQSGNVGKLVVVTYGGNDGINIREKSDFTSKVVAVVKKGQAFRILEELPNHYRIGSGYITKSKEYVTVK